MNNLLYEENDGIGLLTLNRKESLNALNQNLLEELRTFLQQKKSHPTLKVLIVTGAGEKAFIAGADIKEMLQMSPTDMLTFCNLGQTVANLLENAPFVTIAAVNGYALGGGLEMALACDFIYATEHAKLGLPEVTLGIIPGFGGSQRLSRAIGSRQAKEMVATGKFLSAQEAKEIGLINQICSSSSLIEACQTTAEQIAKHSFLALSQGKQAINFGASMGLHEALELERQMCAICFASPEREQAMQAFLNRSTKKG